MKLNDTPIRVVIDSREKRRLLFPATLSFQGRLYRVETVIEQLEAGDYTLVHAPTCAGVERKSGLREIYQNFLTRDSHRASAALNRFMRWYKHPILMLESSVSQLMKPNLYFPCPGGVLQLLFDACADREIGLLLVGRCAQTPSRLHAGELILRTLLAYAGPPQKETDGDTT